MSQVCGVAATSTSCHQNDRPSLHVHLAHRTHACITHRTTPRSGIRIAVSVRRVDWSALAAVVLLARGACGAGALQAGRKSNVSHSTRDRRRCRRLRALPSRPPIAARLSRRVYNSYFWEVSQVCLWKLCSTIPSDCLMDPRDLRGAPFQIYWKDCVQNDRRSWPREVGFLFDQVFYCFCIECFMFYLFFAIWLFYFYFVVIFFV